MENICAAFLFLGWTWTEILFQLHVLVNFFSCQETIFSPEGTVKIGVDYLSQQLDQTSPGKTRSDSDQVKQQKDFSSYPQVSTRATDASGIDVRMELVRSPIWNVKHRRVVSQTLGHGLKKNHSVSQGKLNWSYVTEREPCLEAPIQEPAPLCHWLKAEGMHLEVRAVGEAFPTREEELWEILVLWFKRPMNQWGEMQREFTSLRIPVPAHRAGTRKLGSARHKTKKKCFGGNVFSQEKRATWL